MGKLASFNVVGIDIVTDLEESGWLRIANSPKPSSFGFRHRGVVRLDMWIDSVMFERQADRMPNEPERWLLNDDCVHLCFTFLLSLTPIPTLCSADCRSLIICARFSHLTLL